MSAISSIEWTDRTWNPVRGCSVVSPGCVNCYAMKFAHRFSGDGKPYAGLTKQTKAGPQWNGRVQLVHAALVEPLSWRKPARVFVNSMSDLFHDAIPDSFILAVFVTMAKAHRHTFQVLTKRPARMQELLSQWRRDGVTLREGCGVVLPNVWLGVSCEDQQRADERIPALLQTPSAVRFISAEPLIGPLYGLDQWLSGGADSRPFWTDRCPVDERGFALIHGLDWVIVGGESGTGARDCHVRWVRNIVEQCQRAAVPVFVKQLGSRVIDRNDAGFLGEEPCAWPDTIDQEDRIEYDLDGTRDGYQGAPVRIHLNNRKGGDQSEWPEDLRVREFPAVAS